MEQHCSTDEERNSLVFVSEIIDGSRRGESIAQNLVQSALLILAEGNDVRQKHKKTRIGLTKTTATSRRDLGQ